MSKDKKSDAKPSSKKTDAKNPAEKGTKKAQAKVSVPKIAISKAAKQSKSDRIGLLEKALRATEKQLFAAEHALARAQQELEGERRLREDAANETLAEAEAEEAALAVADIVEIGVPTIEIVPAPAIGDLGEVTSAPPLPETVDPAVPSLAWSLVQLRGEAKSRGLKGYSTLTKPGLVALLTD